MSTKTRFEEEAKGNSEMAYDDIQLSNKLDNNYLVIKIKITIILFLYTRTFTVFYTNEI